MHFHDLRCHAATAELIVKKKNEKKKVEPRLPVVERSCASFFAASGIRYRPRSKENGQ